MMNWSVLCSVLQLIIERRIIQWKLSQRNRSGTLGPIVHKFEPAQLLLNLNNLHVIKQEIQLGFNLFHMGRLHMAARNPFEQNKRIIQLEDDGRARSGTCKLRRCERAETDFYQGQPGFFFFTARNDEFDQRRARKVVPTGVWTGCTETRRERKK